MDIVEVDKINEPTKYVRKGGKQKSGKAPLKHSNFYIQINTMRIADNLNEQDIETLRATCRKAISELSVEIENNLLKISGNEADEKKYNIQPAASKNELWLRLETNPKITFYLDVGEQSGMLYIHYLYSVSKRGLETNIDLGQLTNYLNSGELKGCQIKMAVYRDAKADINAYVSKGKSKIV